MLRIDKRAGFLVEGAWIWRRYRFQAGHRAASAEAARPLRPRALAEVQRLQRDRPVALLELGGRCWWWYRDAFYWEDDGLSADDVLALVAERERRKQRQLERAHAALHQERGGRHGREPIARAVRLEVWRRDGGRCVDCGNDFDLQYDHVIPIALGGASTAANLQLLCASCNRAKGAAL